MAAPLLWKSEFLVSGGTNELAYFPDPQIIGLANGTFLVAWLGHASGSIGTGASEDVIGAIYDAEGNLVKSAFQLNSLKTDANEGDFDLAATSDGGFVMVYLHQDGSTNEVAWERYDSDGVSAATQTIATESSSSESFKNPQVAVDTTDNSSFVTFTDYVSPDYDVRAVRLNADGTVATAEFDAAQNSADRDQDADVALLSNGNMVSVYEEDDSGTLSIEFSIRTTAGVSIATGVHVDDGPADDPHVASLKNGNFVVVWRDGGTPSDLLFHIYDATGTSVLGPVTAAGTADAEKDPEIVATPDGGFFIVWDNQTLSQLEARKYASDGSLEGTQITVTTEGSESSPSVGITGDGRLLVTWVSDGEVFAEIWDARGNVLNAADTVGTERNFVGDGGTIVAGSVATEIYGGDDSESLTGSGFADRIEGNRGNDRINGASGNDVLLGNGGSDRLVGSGGNDRLLGGWGDDRLNGGWNNDKLFGGGMDDVLDGGHGNDVLYGQDGNDILKGSTGLDTLTGGTGADEFVISNLDKADRVTDFTVGEDTMVLDDLYMTELLAVANGELEASQFKRGGAIGSDHRVHYNSYNGRLFYDEDGSGAAERVHIATLEAGLALTASDFDVG